MGTHINMETALENYALGRLPESDVQRLEEHVLLCRSCQTRLQRIDEFIETIRITLKHLQSEPASKTRKVMSARPH